MKDELFHRRIYTNIRFLVVSMRLPTEDGKTYRVTVSAIRMSLPVW